ncbi:hypothetical protein CCP3SC15_6000001 [Gammaproteobacteria bacterium]
MVGRAVGEELQGPEETAALGAEPRAEAEVEHLPTATTQEQEALGGMATLGSRRGRPGTGAR